MRTALRLRPDRLVVGEVRGPEVLALVQALNTGHDGSWSTCHANGALDALHRLETLVLQAAPSWPLAAARQHLGRSIDVVVHVARTGRLARRVVEVGEVVIGGPARRCDRWSTATWSSVACTGCAHDRRARRTGGARRRGSRVDCRPGWPAPGCVTVRATSCRRGRAARGSPRWRWRRGGDPLGDAEVAEWCEQVAACVAWRSLADDGDRRHRRRVRWPPGPPGRDACAAARPWAGGCARLDGRPTHRRRHGLVVPVLAASAHMGGPAASAMDRVAVTLQARDAERAERRTASAQARLSARVLTHGAIRRVGAPGGDRAVRPSRVGDGRGCGLSRRRRRRSTWPGGGGCGG